MLTVLLPSHFVFKDLLQNVNWLVFILFLLLNW